MLIWEGEKRIRRYSLVVLLFNWGWEARRGADSRRSRPVWDLIQGDAADAASQQVL